MFSGLFAVDEWLLTAMLAVVLFLLVEAGFRAGRRSAARDASSMGQVNTIQGASLGLLALLLGFTFSLAANKFDHRRELLVSEANAIGTLLLRTDLLPTEQGSQLKGLIGTYVAAKIEAQEAGIDDARLKVTVDRILKLQRDLWTVVSAHAAQNQTPINALLVQALNDVIDLHTARMTAISYRIPDAAFGLLALIACFAFGLIGYGSGLAETRHILPHIIMIALVSAAILLIIDLDRPQRGLFKVDATPLLALQSP